MRICGPAGILMYHRVADEAVDPWRLCVSPARFAEQMEALHATRRTVPLGALAGASRYRLRRRRFVITFDDGYSDNLTAALPVLERFELPATIFVVSGALDTRREFWWDTLERCVLAPPMLPRVFRHSLAGETIEVDLEADDAGRTAAGPDAGQAWSADDDDPGTVRQALFLTLWRKMVVMPEEPRREALDALVEWAGVPAAPHANRLPMSAEEIAGLARHPLIEIGAHTVTHPSLTDLSPADQRAEIAGAKTALEAIAGRPVVSMSYPYGRHDAVTMGLAREAGFATACTSRPGIATALSARHRLPRIQAMNVDGDALLRSIDR